MENNTLMICMMIFIFFLLKCNKYGRIEHNDDDAKYCSDPDAKQDNCKQ